MSAVTVTGWPTRMSRQLHFLEIGVDPDIGQRHHRHQRRAGGDLLADLHGALGDHAVHRRHDPHMAERDGGVAQLRLRRQHIGIVGDIGAGDAGDGPAAARLAAASTAACGRRAPHRGHGPVPRPTPRRGRGRLAALIIAPGLGQRHLRPGQLGADRNRRWRNSPRTVRTARARLASAACILTLATGGIHLDQQLALLAPSGYCRHAAPCTVAFSRLVTATTLPRDIGVVGAFVIARVQEPVERHRPARRPATTTPRIRKPVAAHCGLFGRRAR